MHEDYASTNSQMHATKLAQSSNINSNTTIYANTLHTCIKTQSYLKKRKLKARMSLERWVASQEALV